MAHNGGGGQDLPATWPFRTAGTLVIAALAWFCLGFAIKDTGETLSGHMTVFWLLLVAAAVFIIGGAAWNLSKGRLRKQQM
jgi:hypothetical protein